MPDKLTAARAAVQLRHPGTADVPPPVDDETVDDLYGRVRDAAGDAATLERLAQRLTPKEVRALVPGMERWPDLQDACAILLQRRMTPRVIPLLWRAWQRQPLLKPLRETLIAGGAGHGWHHAVSKAYAGVAQGWVEDPTCIVSWLSQQALTHSDLPDLSGRPIIPDSPLARLVRETLMVSGSLAQLRAEAEHLPEWHAELDPNLKISFGQHYLRTMPAKEWTEHFVSEIGDTYGAPRRPRVERFWASVPKTKAEVFQRMYIQKRIKDELGHDGDRERFWGRWADHIIDVNQGDAGSVRYADIDFGPFTVFEFFELGNAAYFYLPADAERMRAKAPRAPYALKTKRYYGIGVGDNRLIHNPSHRWHSKGDFMVTQWLEHLSAKK